MTVISLRDLIKSAFGYDVLQQIPQTTVFSFPPKTLVTASETFLPSDGTNAAESNPELITLPPKILAHLISVTPLLDRISMAQTCKLLATVAQDHHLLVADVCSSQSRIFPAWSYHDYTERSSGLEPSKRNPIALLQCVNDMADSLNHGSHCFSLVLEYYHGEESTQQDFRSGILVGTLRQKLYTVGINHSKGVLNAICYEIVAAAMEDLLGVLNPKEDLAKYTYEVGQEAKDTFETLLGEVDQAFKDQRIRD